MNKKEIILKNREFILQKHAQGLTLREICALFEREFGVSISPQYISRLLRKKRKLRKERKRLHIYRNDEKIGEVIKTSEGYVVLFEEGVEPLCKSGLYEDLPPFLDNLLPEGINREILIKKHGIDPSDKFALLAYCHDGFGGYTLLEPCRAKIAPFPRPIRYEESILYEENIEVDEDIKKSIADLYYAGKSEIFNKLSELSGAQPKFSCTFSSRRLYLPVIGMERSNAFMKIVNKNYRNINVIENLFLHFARIELGFPVATTYVYLEKETLHAPSFAKEYADHLIAKRLDRDTAGVKNVAELTTLMGKRSEEKYSVSIEEMFTFLESKLPSEDLALLAGYVYYSFLVGNGDFHAKNIAFYKDPFRLAPLYDVVNTKIYGIEGDLGMRFGLSQSIVEEELVAYLKRYDPSIERIKKRFAARMGEYIERTPLDAEVRKKLLQVLGFES